MIVGQHIGRLGNNMFQIAAAIGYAHKFGYKWAVDPSSGLSDPYSSIHQTFPNLPKADIVYQRRYNEHPSAMCEVHGTHYDYCHYDYHPFVDRGANITLFGFWQSWRYFEDVQETVKKVFAIDFVPGFEDYTSIHVRRGDYVQHAASFPPITVEYIHKAVNTLKPEKVMVFSDDIGWCVANLTDLLMSSCDVVEFSDKKNDRETLSLMSSCGNHIIANSSYSWWGAYLGKNPDRKVVCPSHIRGSWYGMNSGVKKDCVDLIPKGWIEIVR